MSKPIKRIVSTSFWEDVKVIDSYSPEDKFFMLYLLTNPHTTQVGIYKLPYKVCSFETGYTIETIKALLQRFQMRQKNIIYSSETQEIAILNSLKYSIVKGGKPVADCLKSELLQIEDPNLIIAVYKHLSTWWDESSRKFDHIIKDIFIRELQRRKVAKEEINDIDNVNDNDNDNERYVDESSKPLNRGSSTQAERHSSKNSKSGNNIHKLYNSFEAIWKRYPKKAGKKEAFNHYKAWRKKSVKNTDDYLNHKLDLYLARLKRERTDPRFIMNGSTWFNGRFEDEQEVELPQEQHGGFDSALFDDLGSITNYDDEIPF